MLGPENFNRKRVAAYCRVSTDKDDQVNSLESQKRYFHEYIKNNPLWELGGVYVDEGITGTSTKKRYSFHRMIVDAQNHRFDLIITKEISRFARNTLDSIFYTRKLKELGIGVIFVSDNINTLDPDAEFRLTLMSSIAQEESRKTSLRVKWGQKRRMEEGIVFGRDMVGYDVRDGKLFRNEKGAKVVQIIFHKFLLEGKGSHVIARELQEAGIPTASNRKQWSNVVILRILKNEKYVGDLIQKKTYTPNYLNHEKKYNYGEEKYVMIKNHHEAIISRELFERTQEELKRRSPKAEDKVKYSNRYCFSGKIKCGICGSSFVSRTRKRKDGSIYKSWKCYEATSHGMQHYDHDENEIGCNAKTIPEDVLKQFMQHLLEELPIDKQSIINNLLRIINTVLTQNIQVDNTKKQENRRNKLLDKKRRLIELYLSKEISKSDFEDLNHKYKEEIEKTDTVLQELRLKKQQELDHDQVLQREEARLMLEIVTFIKGVVNGEDWNDTFYRNFIDKIVVEATVEIEKSKEIEKTVEIEKLEEIEKHKVIKKADAKMIKILGKIIWVKEISQTKEQSSTLNLKVFINNLVDAL